VRYHRTIIAGCRDFEDYDELLSAIGGLDWEISVVVSGHARGVDKMGERWAKTNGVELKLFPAQWDRYGKSAGFKRNMDMAGSADAILALWDGKSKGTGHMIDIARRHRLTVKVHKIKTGHE